MPSTRSRSLSYSSLLVEAIVDSTDSEGIHWDRVANDASANPRFLYTAQGILSQWLHRVKHPCKDNRNMYQPGRQFLLLDINN